MLRTPQVTERSAERKRQFDGGAIPLISSSSRASQFTCWRMSPRGRLGYDFNDLRVGGSDAGAIADRFQIAKLTCEYRCGHSSNRYNAMSNL